MACSSLSRIFTGESNSNSCNIAEAIYTEPARYHRSHVGWLSTKWSPRLSKATLRMQSSCT